MAGSLRGSTWDRRVGAHTSMGTCHTQRSSGTGRLQDEAVLTPEAACRAEAALL